MALRATEHYESGNGAIGENAEESFSVLVYGDPVTDNADDPAVITLFAIPHFALVTGLGNMLYNVSRRKIAPGAWIVTGSFCSPARCRQTNDASFSFTTGGGTQHITCSRRTVNGYGAVAVDGDGNPLAVQTPPPDCGGSIGNTGDGVQGCDIFVPTFDFKITFYVPSFNMTSSYLRVVRKSARFNSDPVFLNIDGLSLSFQPGELLYLNADGSKRKGIGDWEFTLNFKAADNIQNQSIGPITGINARGWDYIWVRHAKSVDSSSKTLVSTPEAAYVEEVYAPAALTQLLLPTSFGASNGQPWRLVSGTDGSFGG